MKAKCPGQESARLNIEAVNVPCPKCGQIVEMFSDEGHRRCKCGHVVTREALPKCAAWCPSAAECFGEAVDVRLLKAKVDQVKNDPKAKECVETIQKLLANRKCKRGRKK